MLSFRGQLQICTVLNFVSNKILQGPTQPESSSNNNDLCALDATSALFGFDSFLGPAASRVCAGRECSVSVLVQTTCKHSNSCLWPTSGKGACVCRASVVVCCVAAEEARQASSRPLTTSTGQRFSGVNMTLSNKRSSLALLVCLCLVSGIAAGELLCFSLSSRACILLAYAGMTRAAKPYFGFCCWAMLNSTVS